MARTLEQYISSGGETYLHNTQWRWLVFSENKVSHADMQKLLLSSAKKTSLSRSCCWHLHCFKLRSVFSSVILSYLFTCSVRPTLGQKLALTRTLQRLQLTSLQDCKMEFRSSTNYTWNIKEILGQGATGAVYKGRHKVDYLEFATVKYVPYVANCPVLMQYTCSYSSMQSWLIQKTLIKFAANWRCVRDQSV